MKHFIIVLLAGIVTLTIVLSIYRIDLLEEWWLWIVGLIGPIIGGAKFFLKKIQTYLKTFDSNKA